MVACGGMTEREGRLLVADNGVVSFVRLEVCFQKVAFGLSNLGHIVLKLFSISTLHYSHV